MIIIFLVIALAFGLGALLGAPYLPVLKAEHQALLDLCDLSAGNTLLDLGSGDGRFLKAAARRGYKAIGYEINPVLFAISKIVTWPEREQIKIYLGDYWSVKFPDVDVIYVFLIDRFMPKLDQKLTTEITRPTAVVSFVFAIPGQTPEKTTRNAFLYRYPLVDTDRRATI